MNKYFALSITALIPVALVGLAACSRRPSTQPANSQVSAAVATGQESATPHVAKGEEVEQLFSVEGMHCATCPLTVRVAAKGVEGVKEVRVSTEEASARVTFDPAKTSAEAIAARISKAGYPAKLAGVGPPAERTGKTVRP